MSLKPATRAWAKRHDFIYLIDRDLVGWVWPAEHARLVAKLMRDHPDKAKQILPHVLPPVPLEPDEERHPHFIA